MPQGASQLPRFAELELARVRHARRLLANAQDVGAASALSRPSPPTPESARRYPQCGAWPALDSGGKLNAQSYQQNHQKKLDDQRAVIAMNCSWGSRSSPIKGALCWFGLGLT